MSKKNTPPEPSYHPTKGHREIAYYKRIAAECGLGRLRETEILSQVIAQRRQAETALKKVRDELEQRVIERTAALSITNASLKREIQKRARTTKKLAESEKKYRTMFQDSPDAISVVQNHRIVDVNPAWLKLHGYKSCNEVAGRDIIEVIYPADRQIQQNRRRFWPNITNDGYLIRDIRKDGAVVDVEIFASRITVKGRDAILATIHDLTEKKKAEAEKRKLEQQLSQLEKMEAIGALASGVAHDLNNILSGMITYPDLLLLDLPDGSPLKGPLTTIKKSGQKATAVVQDLLTLARRSVTVTDIVDLNQIIQEYLLSPEYEHLIRYHEGVSVIKDLALDLHNLMGSSVHLSKTIMNLVSNAAEAMPQGGTVTIATRNHSVDAGSGSTAPLQSGDYVLMEIHDTGQGIEASDLDRIFEPFYTKKVMGRSGTGLGMAVVWGTVKDHHGHIKVDSVVGKGTRFSLFFPVTHHQQKDHSFSIAVEETPMGKGETILVVDDVNEPRDVASGILSRLGYKVVALSCGEEAVAYTRHHSVHLILLDMIMDPGIDGYETYKQILRTHPGQKAIITSGFSRSDRVNKTMAMGPCRFIQKPYSLANIAAVVRELLDSGTS
jgi:PAS domain S-box-containing protein